MGKNSQIEWTDHTWNPWIGCTKVSDGCKYCYAEREMDHHWHKVQWGPQGTRMRTSEEYWQQPLKWNELHTERRQLVFCASLADVFEERAELVPWRKDLFELILRTPNLDWLVLTKRPENILRMFDYIPDNVWLGVSAENQAMADKRIPDLLSIPAKVHFVSCGPLLGPVDLREIRFRDLEINALAGRFGHHARPSAECRQLDWVIAEGESGPNARMMRPEWVRSLRDQCQAHHVPFFFKQWGEWGLVDPEERREALRYPTVAHVGEKVLMARVGKKQSGRMLDGRMWEELPK